METKQLTEEQIENVDFEMQNKVYEYCKVMYEGAKEQGFNKKDAEEIVKEMMIFFVENSFKGLK